MPILQPNEWRKQFFEKHHCPKDLEIPTKDPDAYRLNTKHNWVYNKLLISELQGIACGPHGVLPSQFPIFSKPIYNLGSMGKGSRVFSNEEEYLEGLSPGYMWSQIFNGEHVSTDLAVVKGEPKWLIHALGKPMKEGTFDYWEIGYEVSDAIEKKLCKFILENLANYTGMINLETIGGNIIEVHLRFADQWPDLYGDWFVPSLVNLYQNQIWETSKEIYNRGYSIVLFDEHRDYKKPDRAFIENLKKQYSISSIQLSFSEAKPHQLHSMPPGGFRIAIINAQILNDGLKARDAIHREVLRIL